MRKTKGHRKEQQQKSPIAHEWDFCVKKPCENWMSTSLHPFWELIVHQGLLSPSQPYTGAARLKCLFRKVLLICGQQRCPWDQLEKMVFLFQVSSSICLCALRPVRAGQKFWFILNKFHFQVLITPWSSVFASSEGGWLLPVSWAELSGLALAFVERCRRVPLPMQRSRFLKVIHISSSL